MAQLSCSHPSLAFGVWGWGIGFGVQDLGLRVKGVGFGVGLVFRVRGI